MYIESITIENFRTFKKSTIDFCHKDNSSIGSEETPRLPNINLLLGNNGLGKTTLLKAISLAALGPAISDSGIYPYRLIRREPNEDFENHDSEKTAIIKATFKAHPQDSTPIDNIESEISISQRGDLEQLRWTHGDDKAWHPIFSNSSDAFFFVAYGATRRVDESHSSNQQRKHKSSFARAQRIQSIFEETYTLLPLNYWLPRFKDSNPGRYKQVVDLINKMMGKGHYKFTGDFEGEEYIFERGGLRVPFPALSDGYRAYLGWIGDLLYHICMTCPSGSKLINNHGIVMVDEIDLHIHPKWQINMLPTLAKALPNIQFIVTSHSPLVVGSLEWMNIIMMSPGPNESSNPKRIRQPIHGLDADQILLTQFFGMQSTRSASKISQLESITQSARKGDVSAAKKLIEALSSGME